MNDSSKPLKKILEVIVTSREDALEAEQGGADRLEVVCHLEQGGLTPDPHVVREILRAVNLPVRVMLREHNSMVLRDDQEIGVLCEKASCFGQLELDGFVSGFVKNDKVDVTAMHRIAAAGAGKSITFHRAFDELSDPLAAIRTLKTVPCVDRILTTGGAVPWAVRQSRLHEWQREADPEITILAGAGISPHTIQEIIRDHEIRELHVGRAARVPEHNSGRVSRTRVARIKGSAE